MKRVEEVPGGFGTRTTSRFAKFLDGDIWLIEEGDFPNLSLANLRSSIYIVAKTRGKKVRTKQAPEGLYVQAYDA